MLAAYLQFGTGTAGPFQTVRTLTRFAENGRQYVLCNDRWRRVRSELRQTFVMCEGARVDVQTV